MKITAAKLESSPEELAAAFCTLDTQEVAEFFAECERISLEWRKERDAQPPHLRRLFFGAGWHWHDVGVQCVAKGIDSPASRVLATMAAPLFAHSLRYIQSYGQRVTEVND